jgi:hypothetical protein
MDEPRTDENLRSFLERRERELMNSIASVKADLASKEVELVEVRRAMGAIGVTDQRSSNAIAEITRSAEEVETQYAAYRVLGLTLRNCAVESLKIKELIAKVLLDHFPTGATPADIGAHIQIMHRRKIDPGSIRPNLARLKNDRILMRDVGTRWMLVPQARTALKFHYKGEGDDDGYMLAMASAMAWRE